MKKNVQFLYAPFDGQTISFLTEYKHNTQFTVWKEILLKCFSNIIFMQNIFAEVGFLLSSSLGLNKRAQF